MSLVPSDQQAANNRGTDGSDGFPNLVNQANPDDLVKAELEAAGIHSRSYEWLRAKDGEVPTSRTPVRGDLDPSGWGFRRAWYYWVADGPGIPPEDAKRLHEKYGKEVRVGGHCGCPGPEYYKGFAVGMYHVDTPRGLKALADLINEILARSAKEVKGGD